MLFDTHAHLNLDFFKKNREEVILKAKEKGVKAILVPAIDEESGWEALELSQNFDFIYVALGLHPLTVEKIDKIKFDYSWEKWRNIVENNKKIVAIGEVGLDKVKGLDFSKQLFFFEKQVEIASQFKKPLIVHNRNASQELIKILKNYNFHQKVIFHCSEPDDLILNFAIENNCYLGFNGDLTYNSEKQNFFKKVPLEMILLETDSPFLVPEPLKSQKIFPNEPKNLKIILNFISKLINQPYEELEKTFWRNSLNAFGL